jgi:hypothetical protein
MAAASCSSQLQQPAWQLSRVQALQTCVFVVLRGFGRRAIGVVVRCWRVRDHWRVDGLRAGVALRSGKCCVVIARPALAAIVPRIMAVVDGIGFAARCCLLCVFCRLCVLCLQRRLVRSRSSEIPKQTEEQGQGHNAHKRSDEGATKWMIQCKGLGSARRSVHDAMPDVGHQITLVGG